MICPECGERMRCVDSRDSTSGIYGNMRRRRIECSKHGRHTSVEILIPDGKSCEVALREMVDNDFRAEVRAHCNRLYTLAGGK